MKCDAMNLRVVDMYSGMVIDIVFLMISIINVPLHSTECKSC